jgi:hypothetical protein
MTDLAIIRDAFVHLCYIETTLGLKILWALSMVVVAFVTRLVVRRQQSRFHVLELQRALRLEREHHRRDVTEGKERIDRILGEAFPITADRTRALLIGRARCPNIMALIASAGTEGPGRRWVDRTMWDDLKPSEQEDFNRACNTGNRTAFDLASAISWDYQNTALTGVEAHAEAGELPWKCECGAILYAEGRHQRQDCLDEREHVGHLVRFDRRRVRPAPAEGLLGEALRKKRDEYKGFYAQGYRDMKIFEVITMIDFLLLAALSTAPAPAIQGVRELQDLYVRWVSDMVLSSANEPPIVDETSESYKQGYQDALVKCSKELRDCIHTPEPPQGDAK